MRSISLSLIAMMTSVWMACSANAAEPVTIGGDTYSSGLNATISKPGARDSLAMGFSVNLNADTVKDAHAMGFNVDINAPVGQDLYATGATIHVNQPIGEDLTVSGMDVEIAKKVTVGGNARLAGGNIVLDGTVNGSLLAYAGSLTLNGTIANDASVAIGNLVFGPDARIGGKLTYYAPQPINIAQSVITPDRVHFERWDMGRHMGDWRNNWMDYRGPRLWPSFYGMFFSFLLTLAFLIGIAAILLQLVPARVEDLRIRIMQAPFAAIGLGILGLGALVGLLPISAMTIIGIPLIPVILLAIVLYWIAGYLLGVYAISLRMADAFRQIEKTFTNRLIIVAIGLAIFAFLNFIPFIGWLINLVAVFLGMGGITKALFDRLQTRFITRSTSPSSSPPPDDLTVI